MKKKNNKMKKLLWLFSFLCMARQSNADTYNDKTGLNTQNKSFIAIASWYGPGFYGEKMASGKIFHRNKILVAHRTLPLGSCVKITCLENGNSVTAQVLDRGPYIRNRGIDLSYKTMETIGGKNALKKGLRRVLVELISHQECRN